MNVNYVNILKISGYHKLKKDKQHKINKAIEKLIYFIKTMKRFNNFIININVENLHFDAFYAKIEKTSPKTENRKEKNFENTRYRRRHRSCRHRPS